MLSGRHDFTATLLQDGTVLVAGGEANSTAELYDPEPGSWAATGTMLGGTQIGGHTATLLLDGSVLVVDAIANDFTRAERYRPRTRDWVAVPDLTIGRVGHTATLMPNGTVLVAGGSNQTDAVEVYQP